MSDDHHAGEPQPPPPSSQQDSAGDRPRIEDGISSCKAFNNQLQEFTQKAGIPLPVYETTNVGPTHEPIFRSTVIVNEVRYDSLLGCANRKAAEQSAAQAALLELAKSSQGDCSSISQLIHDTGLCKTLLQEYAQKMSLGSPFYQLEEHCEDGYQCSVVIGCTRYLGDVATCKKEAEIKASRAALLAIEGGCTEVSNRSTENSLLTVSLSRKRVLEAPSAPNEITNTTPQAKKARSKKKLRGKKKKKPKSQVPDSGPSEHISNDCHFEDVQPGAAFQCMDVSISTHVSLVDSSQQDSAGDRGRTEEGILSCKTYKSQLQEFTQKAGVPSPIYETTKDGPTHEPIFQSTVIVKEVRYGTLLDFVDREAAEQSAAQVALLELAKSGECDISISRPVDDTGLCKSLLQEYAQKMSLADPLYQLEEHRRQGYQCSVVIGWRRFLGEVATSKTEAEIKAARKAWLALKDGRIDVSDRSTAKPLPTASLSRKNDADCSWITARSKVHIFLS